MMTEVLTSLLPCACILTMLVSAAPGVAQEVGGGRDGYVVWEKLINNNWRIWRANLNGSGANQLSNSGGGPHQGPVISTDGSRVAYCRGPSDNGSEYPCESSDLEVWVTNRDGSNQRKVFDGARSAGECRMLRWLSPTHLAIATGTGTYRVHIPESGMGQIQAGTLTGGKQTASNGLIAKLVDGRPVLPSPTGRYAYRGIAGKGDVYRLDDSGNPSWAFKAGGCQAFVGSDDTWAVGAEYKGLDKVTNMQTSATGIYDGSNTNGFYYDYFPTIGNDNTVGAIGKSPGQHGHRTANYEIFVFNLSVQDGLLRPTGSIVNVSNSGNCDRWPDVWVSSAPAPDGIYLSPGSSSINPGDSQTLTVGTTGDPSGTIVWSVSGGGSLSNTSNSSALFTSDGALGTYTVTATLGDLCAEANITVRDGPATHPSVTGLPPTDITTTTARLKAQITSTGGEDPHIVHVYWGDNDGLADPNQWDHKDTDLGTHGMGELSYDVEGLSANTTYYFCFWVQNTVGGVRSQTVSFETLAHGDEPLLAITSPADGDVLTAGQEITVRWSARETVTNIVLDFTNNEGEDWIPMVTGESIGRDDVDWDNYAWTIPGDAAGTACAIRISNYANSLESAESGTFTVNAGAAVDVRRAAGRSQHVFAVARTGSNALQTVTGSGEYRVGIFDARGRAVAVLQGHGPSERSVDLAPLSAGVLVIRGTVDGRQFSQRITIAR